MNILAHRGFWKEPNEKNSPEAFSRAFENGFGVETDVRDDRGSIVICHDMPKGSEMTLGDFLKMYVRMGRDTTLAFNIKSDGLQAVLKSQLELYDIKNYFVFDMSIPDALLYLKNDLNFYERLSEYEKKLVFEKSAGIWVDAFESDWYLNELESIIKTGKSVCFVSPELHKRNYNKAWLELKNFCDPTDRRFSLCTDFPMEARGYFI